MFNQVTIVGVGLLGGSLAKGLRKLGLAKKIVGVCRSEKTTEIALADNVVDEIQPVELAVKGADLVMMATPMQTMVPLLLAMRDTLPKDCLISDVGSVKGHLYEQVNQHCPDLLAQFVLAHPIAGGEDAGVEASKLELFKNKHVIITPTSEINKEAVVRINDLWQRCGANVVEMSLQQHDAIFAKTSHLPHAIAFALVNFLNDQPDRDRLFEMAAAGFYDFTRIASSDAVMWRDICVTNRDQLLNSLRGFNIQLTELIEKVSNSDEEAILEYFQQAKTARDSGLHEKDLKRIQNG